MEKRFNAIFGTALTIIILSVLTGIGLVVFFIFGGVQLSKELKENGLKGTIEEVWEGQAMNNTLICMMGLPRSGKSTWARLQNLPIVNPDSIRLALHGKAFHKEKTLYYGLKH